jgi:hypothetical protein
MLLSVFPAIVLAAETGPLLGSIDGDYYISPNNSLRIKLPFKENTEKNNIIRDAVNVNSINIIFEDAVDNIRYRVDLSNVNDANVEDAIKHRLRQYLGLISRGYHGTPVLIDFDRAKGDLRRYLYKQLADNMVRFHYIQVMPYKGRLLLIWSDFTQSKDTPENEDKIIDGQHPGITRARALLSNIK